MTRRVPASSRCRAYAAALRAAYPLAGFGPAGVLRSIDVDPDPGTVERYRLLLIAAAVARGGPDGAAVAAVLGRGYVPVPGATARGTLPAGLYPITTPGAVWLGAGLPRYTAARPMFFAIAPPAAHRTITSSLADP